MEIVTMINEDKNSYYNRDNYEKIYKKQQARINYNNGNSLNE